MPRPRRLNIPDLPQHITQRGNNRQPCFYADEDYRLYLELLDTACRLHDCSLHAYCLMTNHAHLLMTPSTPEGVSRVMQDLSRDYVRSINRNYHRTGTLWEGRFKSSLVDTNRYCLTCYRYIELNPVRAGMVRHPADYTWSSYRHNANGEPAAPVTPHDCWLLLGENDYARRAAYSALFSERLDQSDIERIRDSINTGMPTGNDRFRHEIEKALSIRLGQGKRGRPKKTQA
ncbi:MAG: transposase [Gammaproteobacteria bacterium]